MKKTIFTILFLALFVCSNIAFTQTPFEKDCPYLFNDYTPNVFLYISPNKAGSEIYNFPKMYVFYKHALLNDKVHHEFCKEIRSLDLPKEFTYPEPFALIKYRSRVGMNVSKKIPILSLNKNITYRSSPFKKNNPCHRAIINKGEFRGVRFHIWESQYWKDIENLYKKTPEDIIFSVVPFACILKRDILPRECYDKAIIESSIVEMDSEHFKSVMEDKMIKKYDESPHHFSKIRYPIEHRIYMNKLLVQSSQPIESDTPIDANIPIMLVDEKNHKNRVDSDDWRIYAYMNNNNGDFFQYFFFEKEIEYEWPLYVRDIALDHLAGAHICKKSTVLVNKKSHEKVFKQGHMRGNNPKDLYISKTKGKQWRPEPVPEDKNTIPKERLFFDREPGRIFGSYAKVWELDVWQMLPNMLRDNPEGVYLIGYGTLLHLNECKTPYEEQALLKKCGVLITPQIYKELQALRRLKQSQSPDTKK